MRKHFNRVALIGSTVLLVACGGGGADDPAPAATVDMVPATATASADAFTRFAAGLAADDQREPLPVANLAPPVSDTAEAAPVMR